MTTEFEIYMVITISMIVALMWASPRYGSKTILIDLGLVGLFGGYTALSTKGVASMLSSTLWRALTTPVTYALLTVLIGTAIMQVKYVNNALQRFDSTQVIPVQFVMFTLSVIIGSAILYQDFEKATAENVGKFVGGCLLTFFGVFLITSGRPRHREDEDEDESDEEGEERIGLAEQEPVGEEGQYEDEVDKYAAIRKGSKASVAHNGDAASDETTPSTSRRSSHVNFVDLASPSRSPRMYLNSSHHPSILLVPSAETPELLSATEATPLLNNPWKSSADNLLQAARHPGIQSAASSTVLPPEAQTPSPGSLKPPPKARSSTQSNFYTHPNDQQGPAPPQAERPVTPARHSISRMFPGPLLSPLSGGLSVVVADSLRRGVDSQVRSKSFKRPRLGLRRTKSGSQRLIHSHEGSEEGLLGTSPLKNVESAQEGSKSLGREDSDWLRETRARSLSNTLGDLFRMKLHRSDIDEDEEAGPSGS
jgi:hypothetical protein